MKHKEMVPVDERWAFSMREVAARLGVSRLTIMRWIQGGKLESVRVGRRVLIPKRAVDALLGGAV